MSDAIIYLATALYTVRSAWVSFSLGAKSLFTAANAYLGLKIGFPFTTSIPAAFISMSLLRAFKNSTILENNTVQTIVSVGGIISPLVFILYYF